MPKPKILTPKQEAFAVAFVRTANAAAAYREAYDVKPDSREGWIYTEAYALLDHPIVGPRVAELRERAKEHGQYGVFAAADELEDLRKEAKAEKQFGPAVSAVKEKIKLFGLEAPQKVQQLGSDGTPVDPAEISMAEIARRMAFVLAAGLEDTKDDT